jgi:NSS family neurotransmitter:Na+ symporter
MEEQRERWSSRLGFILSTVGSAVGLGSIWKFPYEVGANGGGVFIFFYVVGLVAIVYPLMLVEFAVGRRGQSDANGSIALVAEWSGASRGWRLLGTLGVLTSFLILSFYSVIGGWALSYALETAWHGLPGTSAVTVQQQFDSLLASPWEMAGFHAAFMGLVAIIVAGGIAGGIETACKILMPILIVLIILLAVYSMAQGDVRAALRFLVGFDRTQLSAKVVLEALGLGFFSIGVGFAVMITYASYASVDVDLRQVAVATIVGDTLVSCLAGLAIFPVVFAENLDPAGGPGLMFVTLPLAFARVPFGTQAAFAFFVLLAVAGLASALSLLEMPVAFLQRQTGCSRLLATALSAAACWAVGLSSVLSFNAWAGWFPLASIPAFATATVFDLLDHLTSNMMLPAGGLLLAVFGGWLVPVSLFADELHLGPRATATLTVLLRYVVPCGIAAAAVASVRF